MKKITEHQLNWEYAELFFNLPKDMVKEILNDGRIIGRVSEFIDAHSDGGERMGENSSFDVKKENNHRREIRSAVKRVCFASSKEVGYGRKVTEEGFKDKLNSVDDFGIVDSRQFETNGVLSIYSLDKEDVNQLGLGKNKAMSANKFWKIIDTWE